MRAKVVLNDRVAMLSSVELSSPVYWHQLRKTSLPHGASQGRRANGSKTTASTPGLRGATSRRVGTHGSSRNNCESNRANRLGKQLLLPDMLSRASITGTAEHTDDDAEVHAVNSTGMRPGAS
ncbi:hypothetical protein V5799_033280 [Amblyomma americanum]|uniref:Uncharacterized protein n=1 Tax=Amblyomma americanum TaxID=6943 RepID=A0AAQ4DNS0_AMBAM